jgi:hypothetical protein
MTIVTIELHDLQVWVLLQLVASLLCYRFWKLDGLIGSLVGSLIYFMVF